MIGALVQARFDSKRLRGKIMTEILGKPLIGYLLERLGYSKKLNKILLVTSVSKSNDELCKYSHQMGIEVFRGDEDDVLDRYYQAALLNKIKTIVRITGDCPLIDYKIVDKVIDHFVDGGYDYVSNVSPPTYPDGLDVEVFSFCALETAWKKSTLRSEREHVTLYIRNSGLFNIYNVENEKDLSDYRWTVDNQQDLKAVTRIIQDLYNRGAYFDMDDIIEHLDKNPEIIEYNSLNTRNEGLTESLKNDENIRIEDGK